VIPKFSPVDFVSFYLELPVMAVMFFAWILLLRPRNVANESEERRWDWWFNDTVDLNRMDLSADEYVEVSDPSREPDTKTKPRGYFKRLYEWFA
jgi:amino acid transporter, AAT family